jgi:hypothetical protein
MLDELEVLLKALVAELPFFSDKPVDYDGIKAKFDNVMDTLTAINEKSNLTLSLVQGVISSIHCSRKELKNSVSGLIKQTTDQLGKITATTEAATNKILDEAMKLDNDQNVINSMLDELKTIESGEESSAKIDKIKEMIYNNQDSVFNIIQFLQFQDITAQQIAGAYSLLHDTEKTLLYVSNLLKEFDVGDNNFDLILTEIDKNAFNENAAFTDKSNIQDAIDDLFSSGNEDVNIPKDQEISKKVQHVKEGSNSEESFDIDALFENSKQNGPEETNNVKADQDDIDKLFSNN